MRGTYIYTRARARGMYSGSHRKDRYEYIISDLTRGAKNEEKEKRKKEKEGEGRKGKKHFRLERIMFCRECFSLLGSRNGVDISSSAEKL